MFKKILIPTDGSALSAQAANKGVCFAREVGAEIVALYVTQPFAATVGFDGMAAAYAITDEDYDKTAQEQAQKYLKAVLDRAETAGV
ncbi:MAG: universal stress protein, partial [Pollutimonas bauzanensis]